MFKRLLLATVLATATGVIAIGHAQAAPIVQLMVGNTLITDNGGTDTNLLNGAIGYTTKGSGPFDVTINSGIANAQPYLDLASQDVASTGSGNLVIKFTQTGLTSPSALSNYLTMFSGNISGGNATVQLQSYYDASNAAFGTATPLATCPTRTAASF